MEDKQTLKGGFPPISATAHTFREAFQMINDFVLEHGLEMDSPHDNKFVIIQINGLAYKGNFPCKKDGHWGIRIRDLTAKDHQNNCQIPD